MIWDYASLHLILFVTSQQHPNNNGGCNEQNERCVKKPPFECDRLICNTITWFVIMTRTSLRGRWQTRQRGKRRNGPPSLKASRFASSRSHRCTETLPAATLTTHTLQVGNRTMDDKKDMDRLRRSSHLPSFPSGCIFAPIRRSLTGFRQTQPLYWRGAPGIMQPHS